MKHIVSNTRILIFCAVFAFGPAGLARAQAQPNETQEQFQKPALSADQIVNRMQEKNHEREMALHKLEGIRHYSVEYDGFFGKREAEAVVSYNFSSPDKKEFQIISQSGSKFVFDHVIKGLMDGEKEAANEENRRRTALSPRNYDFTLDVAETAKDPGRYVLHVIPKNDNKYVYRGKIWVDASDFAVARIEAEPAKTPSFWVKKSEVRHRYEKVGDFWLPAENKTDSMIRLGGHALLSIEYSDYKLTETTPLAPSSTSHDSNNHTFTSASNESLQ